MIIKKKVNCDICGDGMTYSVDVGYEVIDRYENYRINKSLKKSCSKWKKEHRCKFRVRLTNFIKKYVK